MVVRAYLDQKKTESSDLKKEKKKQYVGFEILVDHENFSDHFLFPYFFNLHSILHFQYLHLF